MNFLNKLKSAVDWKIAISAAVGVGLFGLVVFAARKSGVRPLKKAADAVK